MKPSIAHACLAVLCGFIASCEKKNPAPPAEVSGPENPDDAAARLAAEDRPLLSVKPGDFWKYRVEIQIPEGVAGEDAAEIGISRERTRTYVGKIHLGPDFPEVDAFDVTMEDQPTERELVELSDDRILMRGSVFPDMPGAKPLWLDPAVPFITAGIRPGQELQTLTLEDKSRERALKVVARETITVPAGDFACVRMLMTGHDGKIQIRRTTWFSPGNGIIREEKARYANDRLLARETSELTATSVAIRPAR
jgi:hypothetical protein